MWLRQLVLPGMRRQSGPIVNVSTIGGRLTFPGRLLPRVQACAGGAPRCLRLEVRPLGIDVVVIKCLVSSVTAKLGGVPEDVATRSSRRSRRATPCALHGHSSARLLLALRALLSITPWDCLLRQSFPSPRTRSEVKEQAEKSGYQTRQARKRPERKPEGGRSP